MNTYKHLQLHLLQDFRLQVYYLKQVAYPDKVLEVFALLLPSVERYKFCLIISTHPCQTFLTDGTVVQLVGMLMSCYSANNTF